MDLDYISNKLNLEKKGTKTIFRQGAKSQNAYHKEVTMFEVTEKASDMIKDFLKDKDEFPAIRLMLSQGG